MSEASLHSEEEKNTGVAEAVAVEGVKTQTHLRERSLLYQLFVMLATMVGGLSNVCIKQLLLPIQIGQIDPHSTATSFFIVSSTGAVVGMLAAPLTGAFSDRTTLRSGKRRPWIIFGMTTAAAGMLIMAFSKSLAPLLFGEICAQIGVDTILATVTALIPDQMLERQRWLVSALVGMAPNVGGVIGLLLVTTFTNVHVIAQGYFLMTIVSIVSICAFLFVLREEQPNIQEELPPFHLFAFVKGFVSPLKYRDFRLTFLSRCFAYLTFTILGAFTLFYLQGVLHFSVVVAAGRLTAFQVLSTAILFVASVITGLLARRWLRVKPFVITGALLMAVGLFIMALFPVWSALLAAAAIFGFGFGMYLGVDVALAVGVLPTTIDNGKDLGLMYTAIFLALTLSPAIGAIFLNFFHSFMLLFAFAGVCSLIAALLVLPIKTVK